MAELGRVERPEAEPFRAERKLYLVPLVYSPKEPPADYVATLARYWGGVREHVRRLEERIGAVRRVYHESVPIGGPEGLKLVEQLNVRSHEIASQKVEAGAMLEALEDAELLAEVVDWQRCMMVGLSSAKVANQVWTAYREANKQRGEHLAKRIDETLGPGEAGLLFILEEHSLQFPQGIQVFYVAPPALDEVHRWIRDHSHRGEQAESGEGQTG
jgi:hypothetical protein